MVNIMQKNTSSNERTWKLFTVSIFLLLSVAGFGFSIYLFLIAHSIFLYAIAVSFLALSVLSGFFNVLSSYWYYRSFDYDKYVEVVASKLRPMKTLPTVAVVMPTHDENPEMIRVNVAELKKLNYLKNRMSISVLNDSSDPKIRMAIGKLCRDLHVNFLSRDSNRGFKAGALNNFLKHSNEEYVAIFDADEFLVDRNFLMEIIPYFQDKNIAYVQTEKRYQNGTFFSDSIDIFDAFFFKFIETARAMNGTAIFSGSCGVVRRSVIDEVGGFPEYAIEDTFFSLESDLKGYKGFYLPKVYARGQPINTFSKLVKQQWRYNFGDTQFIAYFLSKKKEKGGKKKSIVPTINYMAHGFGLNYLSVVLIFFTILSTAIVFSTLPFAHINLTIFSLTHLNLLEIAELLGLFAFLLSMFAPVILTKIYFKSFRKGVMVFLLNYALAFSRARAALAAVLGKVGRLNWTHNIESKTGILAAFSKTRVEMAFSFIMLGLGLFALIGLSNIAGGIWLIWYAGMYSLATVFFYKYG